MVTVILWHLISEILFASLQFKFAQCHTWVMKKVAKHKKKMLNIFCIVYKVRESNRPSVSTVSIQESLSHYIM